MLFRGSKFSEKKKTRVKFVLFVLCAWFFTHCILISIDGICDETETADIAVVLGNKVKEDGTLSERLKKRLDRSVQLFNDKQVKKIIVSGGLGKEGFYEGDKMKEYLIQKGIADSLIIVDNSGSNTKRTAENVMALKDNLHFKSAYVVTQIFHISRSKMLFRQKGLEEVYGASPSYFEFRDLYSLVREFFGYYLWWM